MSTTTTTTPTGVGLPPKRVLTVVITYAKPTPPVGGGVKKNELELELEIVQSHMAQKPMLRGEVGARVRVVCPSASFSFSQSPTATNNMGIQADMGAILERGGAGGCGVKNPGRATETGETGTGTEIETSSQQHFIFMKVCARGHVRRSKK